MNSKKHDKTNLEQKATNQAIFDNPDLVDELIDGRWTMDEEEFDQKYASLNSSDMFKVASATIAVSPFLEDDLFSGKSGMWWEEDEDYDDEYYDDEDYDDEYDDDDEYYDDDEYDDADEEV